jgi:hypothetical protein
MTDRELIEQMRDALQNARDEFGGLPRSLGYSFTHLPAINAALAEATARLAEQPLGRFGHHPDPATDFEVEVASLQARLFDAQHGIANDACQLEPIAQVREAIERAMSFRVGGAPSSVRAKQILRELESEAAAGRADAGQRRPPSLPAQRSQDVNDFIARRGGYWLLQWWRLGSAVVGVLTLGFVDGTLRGERMYLDMMARRNFQ